MSHLRRLRKAKLYADEDIEEDAVDFLRSNGVNVFSARESGLRGKPDSFHAANAYKMKRFLLTKNAKDFMDDSEVPFNRTYGVIAVDGDMKDVNGYLRVLLRVLQIIVPYGENFTGNKIKVSQQEITTRSINASGSIESRRYRLDRQSTYEWADE